MDRNDLLTATRVEFLRAFSAALEQIVPISLQRLYDEAERSPSSRDQRRLLEARTALSNHSRALLIQAGFSLEQLLNRAFRTAYSNFRPSFGSTTGTFAAGSLSLVDSSAFEGELRIDQLTQRYRNAAEEQLRDLNIRVALLFDQENIKERENPFRPYLISRSVITAVEQLGLEEELALTLGDQLCEDLVDRVTAIYNGLNELLAYHGIAVELKPRLAPEAPPRRAHSLPAEEAGGADEDAPYSEAAQGPQSQTRGYGYGQAQAAPMPAQAPARPQTMGGRVDRLMQLVRQPGLFGARDAGNAGVGAGPQYGDEAASAGGQPAGAYPADDGGMQAAYGAMPQGSAMGEPAERGAGGLAQMARSGWLAGTEMVGNALRRFFSTGSATGMVGSPLAGDTQSRRVLTASISSMQRDYTPAAEEMYAADGQVRNLIMEQRPSLNEMAKGVNEQMIIDVVAMLFEFILRDDQVPAEVRAQLGRLQFLVLKIALLDPELFTQKHHPARVLVNRIGSISVGLEKAGANTEAMVGEIRQIIERLLADEHENIGLFSRMLDEFDTFIAKQLRAADEQVERAVQALETAENRTLHFARTTAAIAEALAGLTLDPYLHDFLLNGWAHAIERADRDDAGRAERYWMLIPDLIWSIAPKVSKQERDQLLVQIPTMLRTLREGIELIGWDTVQQQALHSWLIDAHTHALRTVNAQVSVPTIQQMRARFNAQPKIDMSQPLPPKASRGPLNRQVLDQTIRELEVELNLLDRVLDQPDGTTAPHNDLEAEGSLGEPAASIDQDDALAPRPEPDVLERLRSGVSVEINLGGKPSLARLNWISPSESSLVLSIDGDHKPAVVSVRLFLRLMNSGRAKFIEVAPLFERAVQSLLLSADQIDRAGEAEPLGA